ncbi:hypothetical protein [Muricoccus vinaceus]|uniref:Uncharacterized protein n=1 Tax=Muricoccus vinaceus TaxID=424704 RepID=A0ABV6ILC7_9PROT
MDKPESLRRDLEEIRGRVDAICFAIASFGKNIALALAKSDPQLALKYQHELAKTLESEMPDVLASLEAKGQHDRADGYEIATEFMASAIRND